MEITKYLGGMAYLPCAVEQSCDSQISKVVWYKGTNETAVAIQTFIKNITQNNANNGRFRPDISGALLIRNLTLGDTGNYTCKRTCSDKFVVQLDVVGK